MHGVAIARVTFRRERLLRRCLPGVFKPWAFSSRPPCPRDRDPAATGARPGSSHHQGLVERQLSQSLVPPSAARTALSQSS
eukprot:2034911-Rhodomonas_salina.1